APAYPSPSPHPTQELARTRDLVVRYGDTPALRGVSVSLHSGAVVAVMGRNGAGKSTLLKALVSLVGTSGGTVRVGGVDPATIRPAALMRSVGLVPSQPGDILYAESVAEECMHADADTGAPRGRCRELFERLAPGLPDDRHPTDLSEGQRLAL